MLKRGNKILLFMVTAAVIALGFGFYVMNQRIKTPPVSENQQNNSDQNQNTQTDITPTPQPQPTTVSTADWKVYENAKHNFSLKYPPYLKAGPTDRNCTPRSSSLSAL